MDKEQSYSIFPSEFDSLVDKQKEEYGLKYFQAIYSAWAINFPVNNPFRQKYILNRKFAEGYESINEEKRLLGLDGDLSYLTLDFRPINRIATLVDNMKGKLTNQLYQVSVNPIDVVSKSKYDKERTRLLALRMLQKVEPMISPKTGIPLVGSQNVPQSDDELDLHMKMNFKTDEAMSMEVLLRWLYEYNDIDGESIPQMVRDMIVDKRTAIKEYFDHNGKLRFRRQDLIDVILPYSKSDKFENIPYCMLLNQYRIGEIAQMTNKFSEEDLYNIARSYEGKNNNPQWNWGTSYEGYYNSPLFSASRPYNNFFITVGEGYFLSTIENKSYLVKHKKSKSSKVQFVEGDIPKDYVAIEENKRYSVKRFEGWYIPNTKYIWGYKMTNADQLPLTIIAPDIFDMVNKSLVERMIPFEKQLNLAHLKFQQFLIKAKPPGLAINLRGLEQVVKGLGKDSKINPTEITKLYDETGNFIFYDFDEVTGQSVNIPFKELQGGISAAFRELIEVHNHYINLMNQVVGFNNATDASTPDKEALVGVNQMAAQATFDCLRPIKMAVTNVLNRATRKVARTAQLQIKYGDDDAYREAIGDVAVEILKAGADTPLCDSAISIEIAPDDNDIKALEGAINFSIQAGTLKAGYAALVRQQAKKDVKLASQLLVLMENKTAKEKQQESLQLQQQNGQVQIQSSQAASQAKLQELQAEAQIKASLIQAQSQADLAKMQFERDTLLQVQKLKNEGLYTQAEITSGAKVQVQDAMNKGKVENTIIEKALAKHNDTHLAQLTNNQNGSK